jgi:hypothetical protein
MQAEEPARQASNLTHEEGAELAEWLLLALDETSRTGIERLWLEETERCLTAFMWNSRPTPPLSDPFPPFLPFPPARRIYADPHKTP